MNGPDAAHWKKAIEEELASHASHGTWTLVDKPNGRRVVGAKWVFKIKRGANGEITRYKARLVAQGFTQIHGIDYKETFAPVVSFKSIRTLLAIAAAEDLDLDQLDVKTAFLYGKLEANVFMALPEGLNVNGQNLVCRLDYGIYGLKQSSRIWNSELNSTLLSLGFKRCVSDPCIYIRRRKLKVKS